MRRTPPPSRKEFGEVFKMKLPFVIALLLVTSSVAAQQVTTSQQPLGTGGQTTTSPLSMASGAICQQEMTGDVLQRPYKPKQWGLRNRRRGRSDKRRHYHAIAVYTKLSRLSGRK